MSHAALSKTPSPLQLRDELEAMVLKELLGPGSAEEEIIESPGTRYFVGVLAPRKRDKAGDAHVTAAVVPPPHAEDEEEEADGEILDGDELALGGKDSSQDGTTDQAPAQDKALIPSSFGMTFSLNLDAKQLQLSAAWGQYVKEVSAYLVSEKTGSPRRVWKRHPRGGTHRLTLKVGPIPPISVDDNCPAVVVQGLVRKRSDHWCVTLFLVNEQQEPERLRDAARVFQPELMAEGVDGAAVIHKRHTILELGGTDANVKAENDLLAMLYRRHVEFAVRHGIGVHVEMGDGRRVESGGNEADESSSHHPPRSTHHDATHAVRVRTKVVPSYEIPRTTPPRPEDAEFNPSFAKLAGMVLDMKLLAEANSKQYRSMLKPLVEAYQDWIDREEKLITNPNEGLANFKQAAEQAIARCRSTLKRIEAGLDLLDKDDKAAQSFQFMNRAMWLQRTHSLFAERVRRGDEKPDMGTIDIAENRSWYPFQLAFILLNLPGITKFDHPERSEAPEAVADLLWFPTGGGKTEAYLGLTAYTPGLRRLQGIVEGRSGENGITVLMRYTLRLLTLQQFQRATALICACEDKNGHFDDFPWREFVHHGPTKCKGGMKLLEASATGEAASIFVQCEGANCGAIRPMSDAFKMDLMALPVCKGRRPHLRDHDEAGCKTPDGQAMRMEPMLQGASNSWFGITLSALAIPPKGADEVAQIVEEQWTKLHDVESEREIEKLLPKVPSMRDLYDYTPAEIWQAVQAKKSAVPEGSSEPIDLKTPEWEVFIDPDSAAKGRDFQLRIAAPPKRHAKYFEKIVLAERLREVRALVGFTRIESPGDYNNPAAFPENQRARLSRGQPTWVPSSEIRGEGLFFHFKEDVIQKWVKKAKSLEGVFMEAHQRWRIARKLEPPQEFYPGVRYVLLHSFAHALIRQLAVECGYTTASLRERIYSTNPKNPEIEMAGVLIYTAAPDSEGTLGGLVSLGKPETLERHLDQALDNMRLCASDPLCAEHHPYHEGITLHAASCHACLFAPETSCERGNKYLDRAVLVSTVETGEKSDLAFFE